MKKKKFKRAKLKAAKILEFPEDVMLDLPRVTIAGNTRAYIDNHMGIVGYTREKVEIALPEGVVCFLGEEFSMDEFEVKRIVISGKIHSVNYGGYAK